MVTLGARSVQGCARQAVSGLGGTRWSATFAGEIDATKLWTGEPECDAHLRSADFFDVENHPTITFTGRLTERTGDIAFKAQGRP